MKITSQKEARRIFREDIRPLVVKQYGASDTVALDEAWNDWIDSLNKDRIVSDYGAMNWTRT